LDENEVKTQEQSSTATEATKEAENTSSVSTSLENTTIKQEESTVAKQETKIQEPTYTIQEYRDNSKALGYSKEVVEGALFNCEKSELTRTDFETLIISFLGKKVE
jgi:hypothetical protein